MRFYLSTIRCELVNVGTCHLQCLVIGYVLVIAGAYHVQCLVDYMLVIVGACHVLCLVVGCVVVIIGHVMYCVLLGIC